MKNESETPPSPNKENQEQIPMKHPHGDEGKNHEQNPLPHPHEHSAPGEPDKVIPPSQPIK